MPTRPLTIAGVLLAAHLAGPLCAQQPVAISHVSVVDPRTGTVAANQLVVVQGGRIVSVGAAGRIPAGARTVDGRGGYLMPGLWDMHVHISPGPFGTAEQVREYYFALLLANGVTGVRDMGGNITLLAAWRRRVRSGEVPGPRMLITGRRVQDDLQHPRLTADSLSAIARQLRADSADHFKVVDVKLGLLPAAAAAARAAGLPLVGHVSLGESADSAIAWGYRSIEHAGPFMAATQADEAGLLRRQYDFVGEPGWKIWIETKLLRRERNFPAPDTAQFDAARLRGLAERARAHGTWFTPTLRITGANLRQGGPLFGLGPAELRRKGWPSDSSWSQRTADAQQQGQWHMVLRTVGELWRAGAPILAGTDFPAPAAPAGISLHDELALLVQAGLDPAAALRAATVEPARYLGAQDSMGVIAPGYVADLVLLDANPLADIANTRRIRAVVAAGRLYDRTQLDRMLTRAAELAKTAWTDER